MRRLGWFISKRFSLVCLCFTREERGSMATSMVSAWGVGVTAGAVEEIAAAIDDLSCNAAQWRDAVWRQRPDLISRFGQEGIVARYTNDIRSLLKRDRATAAERMA